MHRGREHNASGRRTSALLYLVLGRNKDVLLPKGVNGGVLGGHFHLAGREGRRDSKEGVSRGQGHVQEHMTQSTLPDPEGASSNIHAPCAWAPSQHVLYRP